MRKFSQLLFLCGALLLSGIVAVADEVPQYDNFVTEDERQEAKTVYDQYVSGHYFVDDEDIVSSYKVYYMPDYDLIERLKSDNISEGFSDYYSWIYVLPPHRQVTVVMQDDGWLVDSIQTPVSETESSDQIVIEDVNRCLSELQKQGKTVTNVQCFHYDLYAANFVHVETTDENYLIPFAAREDFTLMTNGTLYTYDEVSKNLTEGYNLDETQKNSDANSGGTSVPLAKTDKGSMKIWILFGVLAVCALIGVIVIGKKTYKKA